MFDVKTVSVYCSTRSKCLRFQFKLKSTSVVLHGYYFNGFNDRPSHYMNEYSIVFSCEVYLIHKFSSTSQELIKSFEISIYICS